MKYIKTLLSLMAEDAKQKRALRNLRTLEFSTDYLCYLLQKAGNKEVVIRVENNGLILTLSAVKDRPTLYDAPEKQLEQKFKEYMGLGEE